MDRNSEEYKRLFDAFFEKLINTCKNLNYDLSISEETTDIELLYMMLAEGFIADADGIPYRRDVKLEDVFDDVLRRSVYISEEGTSYIKTEAAISIFTKNGYRQFEYDGSEEYEALTESQLLSRYLEHPQYCVQQFANIKALYDDILIQFKNTDSIFSSDSPAYKELCESMSTVSETLSNCDPLGYHEDMIPVDYSGLSRIFDTLKGSMDYYANTHKGPELSDRQQARCSALTRLSFLTEVVKKAAEREASAHDEFSHGSENLMHRSPLATEELFANDLCSRLALGLAEAKGEQEHTALITDKDLFMKKVNDLGRYPEIDQFIQDRYNDDIAKVSGMSPLKLARIFIKEHPQTAKVFSDSLIAANGGMEAERESAPGREEREPDVFDAPEDNTPKPEISVGREAYRMAAELIQKASVDMLKELKDNESFFHSKQYGKFKAALTRVSGKINSVDLQNGDMDKLGEALQNLSDAADNYIRYHKEPDHTINDDVRNRLMTANNVLLLTQGIARCSEKKFAPGSVKALMEDYVAAKMLNDQMKTSYAKQKEENIGRYLNDKKPRSSMKGLAFDSLLLGLNYNDNYIERVNAIKDDPVYIRMIKNASEGEPKLEALFRGTPGKIRAAYNDAREQVRSAGEITDVKEAIKFPSK